MKRNIEIVCAWGGIIFAVLFGIGFVAVAHFVPPLDPNATAEQIAAIYRDHTNEIRTGLLLSYVGCVFYLAFGASVNAETQRIPGIPTVLFKLQSVAFSSSVLLVAGPFFIWLAAAFRPDVLSAELIQAFNDFGWICFLLGWVPFVTWYVTTGVAILCDARTAADRDFPRWSGYVSLAMGLGQMSASFLIYFKTGPFAWDGLFSWWLPATWFFIWFVVFTVLMVKAINRRYRAQAAR